MKKQSLAELEEELRKVKAEINDSIRRSTKKKSSIYASEHNKLYAKEKNLHTRINQMKQKGWK